MNYVTSAHYSAPTARIFSGQVLTKITIPTHGMAKAVEILSGLLMVAAIVIWAFAL